MQREAAVKAPASWGVLDYVLPPKSRAKTLMNAGNVGFFATGPPFSPIFSPPILP